LSGSIPALAFPEPSLWWLAPVALVPAMLLIAAAPTLRDALWRGWAAGLGYLMGATHWLTPKIGPGIVLFTALVAVTFLPWAAAVFGAARRRRLPLYAAALLVGSAWLVSEAIRSWQSLGGPWGLYGATQHRDRFLLSLASLGGVWLLSLFLVAVNWCVAGIIRQRGGTAVVLSAAALVASGLGVAALVPEPTRAGSLDVIGVQPGHDLAAAPRLASQIALTRSLIGSDAELVVWGESSIGIGLDPDESTLNELSGLAGEVGAPLLVNVDARRGIGGIYKTSTLVTPEGVSGRYDKMRLVPFGEYIPFRSLLGWLTSVSDAADENRRRGDSLELFSLDNDVSIGPIVCFESAFPDMTRNLAHMGADVIVIQSATSTFQDSWAPEQHAALAAMRAVETGRPVVHATLTGASAIFDASGRRLESLPTSQRGTYAATIPLTTGTTLYVRWGDWVLIVSFTSLAAWALVEWRSARRRTRDGKVAGFAPSSTREVDRRAN
jgi:apolipoprotein N-acyltransferase